MTQTPDPLPLLAGQEELTEDPQVPPTLRMGHPGRTYHLQPTQLVNCWFTTAPPAPKPIFPISETLSQWWPSEPSSGFGDAK